ncbi:MAG: protein kinase, partial [Acidimicrobiia bacterium]|nr:protein kinase [Acidimicrobiia bacterium]
MARFAGRTGELDSGGPRAPFVRVFGGMGVDHDGEPISIGGPRQRRLLALLVIRSNTVVSNDWLAENLWRDDERPDSIAPAIRTYISRLRLALPEAAHDWIETEPSGYRWVGSPDAIEHRWFAARRAEATEARDRNDPASAHRLLSQALSAWRGDPFRELEDLDWARAEIEQLQLDRLEMQEERWEAALALGRHTQITGELAAFTAEHGLRDRATRQYALALHRSGRTAEALRVLDTHRRKLADESGLDPSPDVVDLEQAILSGDRSLSAESAGRPLRGYRLLEQAGTGAFAVVWRAYQPSVDREVAVKQIRAELASRSDFIRRFEAEAHLVARIEHPHIVPLIDFWRDPDSAYLVMRWLPGGTLEQRLHDGPLTIEDTAKLAQQVGAALSAAHRHGVVHRDVKSGNILFDDDGNAYLSDFGIALEAASSAGPEAGLSPGSPAYASPEQLRREPLGPEADIFSLGVVVFECLTASLPSAGVPTADEGGVEGRAAHPIPTVSDLRADVPESMSAAVAKATAARPGDRFASVDDFVRAFQPSPAAATADRDVDGVGRAGTVTVVSTERMANPYKGLRAFHDADADDFFGRQQLVEELVDRLSGDMVAARCLVVVGPSGSGKSSVVRAGLIPALRSGAIIHSSSWFTTTMVPGSDPFESLEAALLRIAVNPPPSLLDQLRDGERGILRSVRRCLRSDEDVVVVIIDQFEEVFTAGSGGYGDDFLDALSAAVTEPTSPLRLVATLRADYYDRPLEHPSFAPILKDAAVDVTPLAPAELEQAIVEPAGRCGVTFQPGLVARIVADSVGQPSPLPLLQYCLSELFDHRADRQITTEAYDAFGGLSGALAARAESLYTDASPAEQSATRRVFGRLTNPAAESADLRRRVPAVDLGDDPTVTSVIDRYGAARLLTFDRDTASRERTVEVAHEALLREWPRVVTWLREDRDVLRSLDAVAAAANAWQQGGRQPADLYRGGRLESAVDLTGTAADRLRPVDQEFIEASSQVAEADRLREERRVRRLRGLVAGVGAALVLTLVAGAIAFRQRNDAQTAAAEAEVAGLISRSAAVRLDDPDLGLLLALEAHRRQPGPEAEQAVLEALSSNPVASRISSLEPPFAGAADFCPVGLLAVGAEIEFAVANGQMISRDTLTGQVTEYGPPPEPCVAWVGDAAADRRIAVTLDGLRAWFGPFDGPWEVEKRFDEPVFVCSPCPFNRSHRMLFGGVRDGAPVALLFDDRTGDQVGPPIVGGIGELTGTLSEDGALAVVSFGPDPGGGEDGSTAVVDGRTGEEVFRLDDLAASAVILDDAAGELVAGTFEGAIVTVELATGLVVSRVETTAASRALDLGLRPDGLVVVTSPDRVELVDRRTGPVGGTIELPTIVMAELREDGTLYTRDPSASRAEIYELEANALADRTIDLAGPSTVAFAAGSAVATGGDGAAVEEIDLATGDRSSLALTTVDGEPFPALVAVPDSGGYLAISADARVGRWEGGQMTGLVETASEAETMALVVDVILAEDAVELDLESGHMLVVGFTPSRKQEVSVVNIDPGEMELVSTTEVAGLVSLAPDRDRGFHVLLDDGTLRTYDLGGSITGELDTGFLEFTGSSITTAHDFARGRLAFGSAAGAFIVHPERREVTIVPTFGPVSSLAFARDGAVLAIGT